MARRLFYTIPLLLLVLCQSAKAQLTVTNETDPLKLAQKILGAGVTIMNAQFKGNNVSAATFKAVTGSFPIDSGIVLTSGRAKTIGALSGQMGVDGPANYSSTNDVMHASFNGGGAGDPDLSILSGRATNDACILEFDFIPQGDSINVRYIFGSEEYPRYTCTDFNDVFGFLITGPGFTTPKNIAVVPGTNIPVTINSINDGVPGANGGVLTKCTDLGPGSPFTQYYINNNGGLIITYNGHTVVLTAKAKVTPCQVYHIKLAIADTQDWILDSGVFIEAGSFSSIADFSTEVSGSADASTKTVMLVEGCRSAELKITRAPATVGPFTINVSYTGSATAGIDFSALPATVVFSATDEVKTFPLVATLDAFNEGTERTVISLSTTQTCSNLVDSIVVLVSDSSVNTALHPLPVCRNDSVIVLSGAEPEAGGTNSWSWNTGAATQTISINHPGNYIVTHVFSQRCLDIDSFEIVNREPLLSIESGRTYLCPGDEIILHANTNADTIQWQNGSTSPDQIVSNAGIYRVRGANTYGCSKYDTVVITSRPAPVLELGPDTALCAYETIDLDAFFPGATYSWNTGASTPLLQVTRGGFYRVISTLDGCSVRDSITITDKKMPVADAGKDQVIEYDSHVQLNAKVDPNNAGYAWSPAASLNNATIPNPIASPLITTEYTLIVSSADGCSLEDRVVIEVMFPLAIPNAFSPNGDGVNDRWNIGNIHQFPQCDVYIYNRYGQQMFYSRGYKTPWDGSHNGKALSPATYYYVIDPGFGFRKQTGWILLLK
ncbi:MAG TPA: choice-of-anchor L domain-containing protein [Chitinophagaceae bacterium]